MPSHAQAHGAPDRIPVVGERRKHQRHSGNAIVRVIRESDTRRMSLPVELIDISITGLGILATESFAPDERVKIRLRNDIRRFSKEVHGIVRWCRLVETGKFRVGIELNSRFSSLDMQLLKQVGTAGESGQKVWI
jgi:hypothetical protein